MTGISSIEEILDEARNGRMFILVDDEDRENEGDLIIAAQMATPSAINFMATHGRGLICLAITQKRANELDLSEMSERNGSRHSTAFTVSIEAKVGVTTGISASDRARTIAVAINGARGGSDLVSPGHVFPLVARDGGVLVRAGHTEAAVDVARLAGLIPSGVICEIMNEDGTMARLDDLLTFAERHGLKVGTIKDLIAYRLRSENLVECVSDAPFVSDYGGNWRMLTFRNSFDGNINYALQKGIVRPQRPTLVRVHSASVFADMLGEPGTRKRALQRAMNQIGRHGEGVIVVLIPQRPEDGWAGHSQRDAGEDMDLRTYGIGAQILAGLGVHEMTLLTNSSIQTLVALEGYGLTVAGLKELDD